MPQIFVLWHFCTCAVFGQLPLIHSFCCVWDVVILVLGGSGASLPQVEAEGRVNKTNDTQLLGHTKKFGYFRCTDDSGGECGGVWGYPTILWGNVGAPFYAFSHTREGMDIGGLWDFSQMEGKISSGHSLKVSQGNPGAFATNLPKLPIFQILAKFGNSLDFYVSLQISAGK